MNIADDKQTLLQNMAEQAIFSGWNKTTLQQATHTSGLDHAYARILFPNGVSDLTSYFTITIDQAMLQQIQGDNLDQMRIRDRIPHLIMTRLNCYNSYTPNGKELMRQLTSYYANPCHSDAAIHTLWQTTDLMWRLAGDKATDFNHYTKRLTLAGVYSSTLLYWIDDESINNEDTQAFLNRRINNVMQFQKLKSAVTNRAAELCKTINVARPNHSN